MFLRLSKVASAPDLKKKCSRLLIATIKTWLKESLSMMRLSKKLGVLPGCSNKSICKKKE